MRVRSATGSGSSADQSASTYSVPEGIVGDGHNDELIVATTAGVVAAQLSEQLRRR